MNLHPESYDAFLYVAADGEIDFDSSVRLFEQAVDLAAEKRVSKILVDGSFLSGKLSPGERVELAVKAADHMTRVGSHPSVAIVGYPPVVNGLAVIAGQMLGTDVELFLNIREALTWLSGSESRRHR